MPIGSGRASGGRLPAALTLALGTALGCSAPDSRDLFQPLPRVGAAGAAPSAGGAAGASAGSGGAGVGAAGGGAPNGGAGAAGGAAAPVGGASSGGSGAGGTAPAFLPDASAPAPSPAGGSSSSGARDAGLAPGCERAEVCNGLDDDCDGEVDPGATCAADCRGFALAERGYMFCAGAEQRDAAVQRCTELGMNLTWIESAQENESLVGALAPLGVELGEDDDAELLVQIGASDAEEEETWVWVANELSPPSVPFWAGGPSGEGGEALGGAFESWAGGEPNDDNGGEDCGVLSVFGSDVRDPGQWDDRACDTGAPFVCESL